MFPFYLGTKKAGFTPPWFRSLPACQQNPREGSLRLLRRYLRPGVLQADGAIEDGLAGLGVLGVGAEVAGAFELHAGARCEG